MTIPRSVIQQAFPDQPRMQAAFETLVSDADDAIERLNTAIAAIGDLSGGAADIVAQLAKKQPKNDTLSAISGISADPGAIEQTGSGTVAIRPIDAADTRSLLSRAVADTRYLGKTKASATADKLTTARSIAITGDVTWSVTFDGSSNVTAAGTIQANTVSLSKLVAATQKALIGANAAGNFQEVTLGTGISLVAGVLSATGTGGSVTSVSVVTANGISGTVANPSTTPAITLTLGAITPSSVAATGTVTGSNLSGTNTGDQTSVSGNAGTATKLATARSISITGDVAWTIASFDGSANVTAAATIQANAVTFSKFVAATQKALVGATAAGNFGEVTLGSGLTLLAGVLDRVTQTTVSGNAGTATALATGRTISMTGDVAWTSPAFDGTGNVTAAGTLATVNANVGSWGSATQVATFTVNGKGLTTASGNVTITPAVGSITGLGTGVATALAINVGLAGAFATFNGALGTPSSGTLTNCTFPTLNQNTTGSAATLTTSRNIDGQAFNGSANITVIAPGTHAATSKTTPVDADELPLVDSAASNVLAKLTWANLKAALKTYLDTLYQPLLASILSSWTAYTPTVTPATGSFTTVSATGRYRQVGKTVQYSLRIFITTNGTAGGIFIDTTAPVASVNSGYGHTFMGIEELVTGTAFRGYLLPNATKIRLQAFDGATYLGASGYSLAVSGTYEAA